MGWWLKACLLVVQVVSYVTSLGVLDLCEYYVH